MWPTDTEIIGDGSVCRVTRRDWPRGSRFFVYLPDTAMHAGEHVCPLEELPAGVEEMIERWRPTEHGQILHYLLSARDRNAACASVI
jgi:hypothetical protein